MGKRQDWYITTSVFLFMYMTSQIHCTTQTHFIDRLYRLKQGVGSSGDTSHINAIRRLYARSLQTKLSSVDQQKLRENDLITQLPGHPPVNFKQYGGYVATEESTSRFLYYYFVETIKANDSVPLVIWFNGGPGCSSLLSAFTGHGPFRIHSDGKTLYRNPYSWNNEANILYVESPIHVGFSYNNISKTEDDFQGDNVTAEDNYLFLVRWLERFPEYKNRELYIAAQSYGGHYGPQLAKIIINRINQTFINLQGVLLGNPSFDEAEENKGYYEYMVSHAIVNKELVEEEKKICNFTIERPNIYEDCQKVWDKIDFLSKKLDLYDIYAPLCLNSTLTNEPKNDTSVLKYDPCSEAYLTAYLNLKNVQEMMHANTTKLPYKWTECNERLHMIWSHEDQSISILPILHELMEEGVRVFVYNGDVDAVVSVTSTMNILKKMNLTVEKEWRSWVSEGEIGGYTKEYKGKFTYATVRGGGHAVSTSQPIRALTLFTSFIRNISLPNF